MEKSVELKTLDEVVKDMPNLAEVMQQCIGQPQPNSDFTAKFASELVDGVLAKQGDLIEGILAKQGLGKRQPQYQEDGLPSLNSVSTYELVERFLATKRAANLREESIRSYRDTLMQFARAYPILPAKPEQIEEYLSKHRGENTTAKNIYIVLSLLYKFASSRLGLPNPMTRIDKPRAKPKAPQPLSVIQAKALLNAIEDDRERGLIYCLFGLGLRLKETRYLRVADIGEDIIRVVHGKERDEPMPLIPEIRDILLKLSEGKRPEDYIFRGRNGQPLSDSTIQLIIKRLFARAGIIGVRASPHTLRHSRGAITAVAGLDTVSSSRLLRHADIKQTEHYSQLNLEQLRVKEERFNPLRILDRQLGKKPDYAQG